MVQKAGIKVSLTALRNSIKTHYCRCIIRYFQMLILLKALESISSCLCTNSDALLPQSVLPYCPSPVHKYSFVTISNSPQVERLRRCDHVALCRHLNEQKAKREGGNEGRDHTMEAPGCLGMSDRDPEWKYSRSWLQNWVVDLSPLPDILLITLATDSQQHWRHNN